MGENSVDELLLWAREKLVELEAMEKAEAEKEERRKKIDAKKRVPAPLDGFYCRNIKPCKFYRYEEGKRWCTNPARSTCPEFQV